MIERKPVNDPSKSVPVAAPDPVEVNVVVMHPSALMRALWKQLLDSQPDFSVVAEVGDVAKLAELTQVLDTQQQPWVVMVDLDSGERPDMRQIAYLRSAAPQARLVAVSAHDHDIYVMDAIRLGVHAFVSKSTTAERAFEVVRMVSSDRSFIHVRGRSASGSELNGTLDGTARFVVELSKRERDVLTLVAQGKTNEAVGKELLISASTVKYHLNNVFQKLEATNRTEAVRIALRLQLVDRAK